MMGRVRFPFHVKANGEYHPPGAAVEAEDVAAAVAQGAEPIEEQRTTEPPTRGRKRKTE